MGAGRPKVTDRPLLNKRLVITLTEEDNEKIDRVKQLFPSHTKSEIARFLLMNCLDDTEQQEDHNNTWLKKLLIFRKA